MSKLAELRQKPNAEWLAAFKPCEGQVSEQDWTGTLVDLFSPDYFSADRKPWDKNPNSRRFIDLRDGELQISEDLGDGSRSGRRFDPTTTGNPILAPTGQPSSRHMSFLCKFAPGGKAYKDARAGAFEFTGVLGTAFGEKVLMINTVYNGKGGPVEGFEAPPDEFNFWLYEPKATMERIFLFSSESVNEGHPDKLCDQVSDAVLDACLTEDPKSKVACETATKDNMVMLAGEITTQAKLDYEKVVRGVVAKIGFDSYVDDLSSVDSKGLCDTTCEVLVRINKQSPDIAGGVHVGKDEMDVGAGDQGIMFGYASDETEDCMPLTHSVATKLGKKLTDVRKNGKLWWLRPDGKTQVTIEYLQKADGSVEPQKFHTIVISTQHAEPSKASRCKEVAGYTGADETAPSMEEMNKAIVQEVIVATLSEIKLKNGESARTLFGDFTHLHINPSGKFIIGGPQGDAGLTGRKIIIDTYGGWGAHGGGAFSGKDPTKVDRSAAYICRQMAKSVVKSGLCKRALVQLSYAIGVAKPLSLFVETYGTQTGSLTPDDITNIVKIEFDCRPGAIAASLSLREPKYQETAAYCHFGREPVTKNGMKFFEWENAKDLTKYSVMNSTQVTAALKESNYLTKWVD